MTKKSVALDSEGYIEYGCRWYTFHTYVQHGKTETSIQTQNHRLLNSKAARTYHKYLHDADQRAGCPFAIRVTPNPWS